MKLLVFILILFILDIYFYLGTVSLFNKSFNYQFVYKLIYWLTSILVYLAIIYIVVTYNYTLITYSKGAGTSSQAHLQLSTSPIPCDLGVRLVAMSSLHLRALLLRESI